jgi:site-specific DNA-methyltransferase (adenine-specific)/modification methylase
MKKIPDKSIDLVLTDPPYGIGLKCKNIQSRLKAVANKNAGIHTWTNNDYPDIGDDKLFNPEPLLRFPSLALFGANNYASKLPDKYSWLVWDKKTERGAKNHIGDCELIWCRGSKHNSVRIFRHMWNGYQRDSEVGQKHLHPTQKPVALIEWVLSYFPDCNNILDPYMGSGTTGVACKKLGKNFIGIEIEPKYFEIAQRRIQNTVELML